MKVSVCRTAMIGVQGGMSYDVRVPIECVPNYDGTRYITICSEGRRFVDFVNATLPESHFAMPRGVTRYTAYLQHQKQARRVAFDLAAYAFPELEKIRTQAHGTLPELWALGLLDKEFSAEVTIDCHCYACGCFVPTKEPGRYYDHACATCHRENWTVRR